MGFSEHFTGFCIPNLIKTQHLFNTSDVKPVNFWILLSGNASKVTYFKVGQIFKEKQNKIIYFPIYNNNFIFAYKKYVLIYGICIN